MNFADQRVLKLTPATLAVQFVDQDGANATVTDPVTVGIVRADGTVLQAPGGATGTSGTTYTFPLTAVHTATLDRLTCTWTATSGQIVITHVDVVGGYGFTLSDMASLDGMSGLAKERQRDLRQAVEELVEIRTGWLWTRRVVVETFEAWRAGSYFGLSLPSDYLSYAPAKVLRSVKVDTVAQTLFDGVSGIAGWRIGDSGQLTTTIGYIGLTTTAKMIEVIYEAGEDRPPVSLTQALLDAARQNQLDRSSGASSRVLSMTNEFGNINYARATAQNLFGNPAVDAVLEAWNQRAPSIAGV